MNFYDRRRSENPFYFAKLEKYVHFFSDRRQVLELGCGQGEFLHLLKGQGVPALGIDLSTEAISACKSRGLKVQRMDALKAVSQLKGRMDGIFSSNVIEHLPPEKLESLFDRVALALPRGGKFAMTTANPQSLGIHADSFWHDITHVRMYPAPLLKSLLEKRGFRVLQAGPDEDSRSQQPLRRLVRGLRKALIGDYFGPPELCVLAIRN